MTLFIGNTEKFWYSDLSEVLKVISIHYTATDPKEILVIKWLCLCDGKCQLQIQLMFQKPLYSNQMNLASFIRIFDNEW